MPRTVVLTSQTFEKIISFLGQHSNPLLSKKKCVEAFGFLFCRRTPNYYIIEDAVGVATGERVAVALKAEELAIVEFLENQRPELFLGGWVHSHPGYGLFFSGTDEQNQVFYQQMNEDGLGIVWDYTLVGKKGKGLGFAALRLRDPARPGYVDVSCKLSGFSLDRVESIFAPLGYNKKAILEAWRTTIEQSMLLTADEESEMQAEVASVDMQVLTDSPMEVEQSIPHTESGKSEIDLDEVNREKLEVPTASVITTPSSDDLMRATSLREMGKMHYYQKYYKHAATELRAALKLHRADPETWAFIYMCLYNLGDQLAAYNVFRELGEYLGEDAGKWLEVARLCEEHENFEGAHHAYTQVIKYDPMNFDLLDKIKELSSKTHPEESSPE